MRDKLALLALTLLFFFTAGNLFTGAVPEGASFDFNSTESLPVKSVGTITTAGGSFTVVNLNVTNQNSRWKAYVGNATGTLTLQDGNNYTIYDWSVSAPAGEVYATRGSSVTWASIRCAGVSNITSEQTALNISTLKDDSINNTFLNNSHKAMVVGDIILSNSSCFSIATYVNSTAQASDENALFQELLLSDVNNIVYSTIIENNRPGYNNASLDFQMIVPDYGNETITSDVPYYFYIELS
ncbi:hypothetical protein J4475_02900 [Candidatus Woesearchaeota archaeon]|nr:hypothetical protein [Candidatus Woesearchaeota archaeon]